MFRKQLTGINLVYPPRFIMYFKSFPSVSLAALMCAVCIGDPCSSVARNRHNPITGPVHYYFGCQSRRAATNGSRLKYRVASDTVHVFGNGRFQVAKIYNDYGMFDSTSPSGVAMNVINWVEKGKFGYVIGEEGFQPNGRIYHQEFFLIYLPGSKMTKYSRLSRIPLKHRQVFNHLQKSKRMTP